VNKSNELLDPMKGGEFLHQLAVYCILITSVWVGSYSGKSNIVRGELILFVAFNGFVRFQYVSLSVELASEHVKATYYGLMIIKNTTLFRNQGNSPQGSPCTLT
jgi:hypothetical protein